MITRDQISTVLDHAVYDSEGAKIGEARHVFVDDMTGEPDWVSVRTGLFGRNESFIPTRDARLVTDHLEVPYLKSKVKDAPHADIDGGGHLSAQEERKLYRYYGLDWGTGTHHGMTGGGTGEWTTAPDAADTATADTASGTDTASAMGTAGRAGAAEGTGGAEAVGIGEAMTRSEEEMHVRVERRATGQARLHKYVVTEEVQETVPLRHESVRVIREPITDENIADATAGPEISEAEHTVTLHDEQPVVETQVVPKERVRLGVEEHTDETIVRGRVRKERIEAELPDEGGTGETGGDPRG